MTALDVIPTTTRLLRATDEPSFGRHLELHGPLPDTNSPAARELLLREVELSGLCGRGGAGFWTHLKLRSVSEHGRSVLIANAMEGEPGSRKDAVLLQVAPHLVLDGIDTVASAIGATRSIVCVADDRRATRESLLRALAERPSTPGAAAVEVVSLPARYVAGEESALVAAVGGHAGVPKHRYDKSVPLAMGRRAALVQNVETLAHVALIWRHGADWFSSVGTPAAPGTALVTVSGDVERPRVVEVELGMPIDRILAEARPRGEPRAVLVGGYGGTWLAADELGAAYSPEGLRSRGGSIGAGVLVVLAGTSCGVREVARIARFMAAESAGQCGPCLFGLPALADDLHRIANGEVDDLILDRLVRRCNEVDGRGACRHPDGVARMVLSALRAFADDFTRHLRGGSCTGSTRSSLLSLSPREA